MNIGSLDHLLPAAKAGDEAGLNKLCEELKKYLTSIYIPDYSFHGYGKQDLIQDTILIILEKIVKIEKGLKSFAYRVIKNKVGDNLRKKYGKRSDDSDEGTMPEPREAHLDYEVPVEPDFEFINRDLKNVIAKRLTGLKKFCQLIWQAATEGLEHKLYDIYQTIYPDQSRSNYHVQVFRCRESFKLLINREDLI